MAITKIRNMSFALRFSLSALLVVASFCGLGSHVPGFVEMPHATSDSNVPDCEKNCLTESIANQEAPIFLSADKPLPLMPLPVSGPVSTVSPGHENPFPLNFIDPQSRYPNSTKRYQILSAYRI